MAPYSAAVRPVVSSPEHNAAEEPDAVRTAILGRSQCRRPVSAKLATSLRVDDLVENLESRVTGVVVQIFAADWEADHVFLPRMPRSLGFDVDSAATQE